ncbi:MAG: RidA family protein [Zoogloeaceae bacterium]|nr:RidA family protein [Zoogloeaceae bacterium]
MMEIQRFGTTGRYSDAVAWNGLLHLVEVPAQDTGDIEDQTRSLLASLGAQLESAGSGKDRLLMVTVYLVDMADYAGMNAVWESWLPPGAAPSRACVQVARLARSGWRVEMAVVAAGRAA